MLPVHLLQLLLSSLFYGPATALCWRLWSLGPWVLWGLVPSSHLWSWQLWCPRPCEPKQRNRKDGQHIDDSLKGNVGNSGLSGSEKHCTSAKLAPHSYYAPKEGWGKGKEARPTHVGLSIHETSSMIVRLPIPHHMKPSGNDPCRI